MYIWGSSSGIGTHHDYAHDFTCSALRPASRSLPLLTLRASQLQLLVISRSISIHQLAPNSDWGNGVRVSREEIELLQNGLVSR
jgi:hypothetical protein